jgi:HAE1 family hydrophobic/amphiphilic exporter-1
MFLTEQALQKASVTLLIAIALVIGGVYAALNINQELIPDVDFPLITVVAASPGASPQDVAETVSGPLEAAIANVPGLQSLQSISAESVAIIIAQFDFGHDMKAAERDISQSTAGARLPSDVARPQVTRININQTIPVIQLSLGGDLDPGELEAIAQQELVPRIRAIDGVQAVDVIGGASRQINVLLDLEQLRALAITVQQVSGVLRANNISIPSGAIRANGALLPIRTVSELTSLAAIENLIVGIQRTEGQPPRPVRLQDIGTVELGPSPAASISRTNGKPSVGIAVTKTQQGNTVAVADAVRVVGADVQAKLGDRVEITTILDQSRLIEESIAGLTREGVVGAGAAVFAIWLFLMNLRSTIAAAVSIPLSLVVAVLALFWQGFTINILTLGGLTIALGRVVDDSIVVLENTYRHVQEGDDLQAAVLTGTREVTVAIFGSTLTSIAVFLPMGFVGGITGVFFRPFALAVVFAMLASLVVALTVVPVLARFLIGSRQVGQRQAQAAQLPALQRVYTPVLAWSLRHRVWTLLLTAIVFGSSLGLLAVIPRTFLAQGGENRFIVSVSPPPGTGTPEEILAKASAAEEIVANLPGVAVYSSNVSLGTGGQSILSLGRAIRGQGTRGATIIVALEPDADLAAVQNLARSQLSTLEGVLISIGGGAEDTNSQLQLQLTGQDPAVVRTAAVQVLTAVRDVDGLEDVATAAVVRQPEIVIRVDPARALVAGLTGAQVAQELRTLIVGQTVTRVHLADEGSLDLVLRARSAHLDNLAVLSQLPIGTGRLVALATVADIEQVEAPAQVTRTDQRPSATITGRITAQNTGEVNQAIQERVAALALPAGVSVTYGGALLQFQEGFSALYVGIAAAVIIVYIVMVLVMGSLRSPFVIMFCLPLAAIGALAALSLTGRALGVPSMFGFLMLVGIVVTNGIVLIDFVNQLRARGLGVYEALILGGRLRIRPVLMTAVTTILALIPMSLGFTEGAIIAAELAVVVMGGLVSSTVLTLVVVPVVYSFVHRMGPVPADG